MLVLAFDTCMDKMYVTLVKDEQVLKSVEVSYEEMQTRSPLLLQTIRDILLEYNLNFTDLDLLATSVGPGGFTAIRTCMTVARVMAQELNKKLIGVTSFEILSNLPINYGEKKKLIALDARRESAYVSFDGEIKGIVPLEDVKALIASEDCFVVTDNKLKPVLGGISYQEINSSLGEIIAKIAITKSQSETGDWGKLTPLYLSSPANAKV